MRPYTHGDRGGPPSSHKLPRRFQLGDSVWSERRVRGNANAPRYAAMTQLSYVGIMYLMLMKASSPP